jgi:predicted permease
MSTLLQDLRYSARQLIKGRASTVVAVLTLALGIGANTSVFTLLNATLFRSAPVADPDHLVWITGVSGHGKYYESLSYPDYTVVRDNTSAFSGVVAWANVRVSLGGATPVRAPGQLVSGNFFDVLGVHAERGRTFRSEEDGAPGAHPVVVVSDAYWHSHFGADARIVDSTITLDGHPFTVIGIAPRGFGGVELNDEEAMGMWIPMAMTAQVVPEDTALLADRNAEWLRVAGRLTTGVSLDRANAALGGLSRQLRTLAPRDSTWTLTGLTLTGAIDPTARRQAIPVFALVMLVPALVLLVACANVANLLLARALARRKEFAMRLALGATRGRMVRQLLTESVVLSVIAGAAGVVLSFWMTSLITHFGNIPVGIAATLTPDLHVLAATGILALLSGAIFGLAPALSATKPSVAPALKEDGVTLGIGAHRHRLRDAFVVGQVAVSLVLLITAGLFLQSLSKALRVDPGFDPHNALTLSFDLGLQGYSGTARKSFERDIVRGVAALPGVESAALAEVLPLSGRTIGAAVRAEGAPSDQGGISASQSSVSPGFFHTMHIPLTSGREFTDRDDSSATPVVIVNAALARVLWAGAEPIGKRLRMGGTNEVLREVIGVAADVKYRNLTEERRAFVYLPQRQHPSSALSLVVRSNGDPAALIQPITRIARDLDPQLPIYNVMTLTQMLRQSADIQQAASAMLGVFGGLALLLAALGMYGVTAHGVAMRTREIGIRMSLGARTGDVLSLFVREGVGRSLIGVAIGLVLSAAVSTLAAKFLFGLGAMDTLAFAGGAVILCAVAAVASYVPARRAAKVDPVVALRYE